jgi:tetratricopeptide (TPR) repeat protein
MANSLLFDVYDRIDERGASIPVRESIVRESIHYLDSLSRSAGNDLSLRQELALGYRRLTLLQSGPMNANKGDLPGALASSQKAIALQESVVAGSPTSTSARSLLADLYDDRAYLVKGSGDAAGARSLAGRAVQTGRDLLNSPLPEDRLHAAVLLLHASMLNRSPDVIAQGIGQLESATAILDQLETQGMKTDRFRTQRASAHKNLGAILAGIRRDFDTARRHYLTAYEIEQALVAAHPENTNLRYDLTFTESDLASIDSNQGRKSQALEAYRNVLAVRERMLANDPEDVRTKLGVANTCRNLSSLLGSVQQFPEAVQFARRAATLDAELKRQGQLDPIFSARTFRLLGDTYLAWSKSAPSQERMDKAHEYYRSALPIFRDQGAKGALVGPEVDAVKNIEASLAEIARRGN